MSTRWVENVEGVGGKLLGGGSDILLKAIIFRSRTKINLFKERHFTYGPGELFKEREDFLSAQKEISIQMWLPIKQILYLSLGTFVR